MISSPAFREIEDNLSFLDDWEDRYRYIIELGQALPRLAPEERTAANKVSGCVSQVWLVSEPAAGVLHYRGESDAMIVGGLVAILVALTEGQPATDVADADIMAIFDRLGLREHLSTQRSNGLAAMVARIKAEAAALTARG